MLTPLPDSVRGSWRAHGADDFSRWLDTYVEERTAQRDESRKVLSRLDVFEARFDQVDERLNRMEDHLNDRFEQVHERFERVDERFAQMNNRLDRMHGQIRPMTRWPIGLLALFGTLVRALLSVSQFAG